MNAWLYLAVGGTAGTLLRYLLAGWIFQRTSAGFPYGTLMVNLTGCFLIGFINFFLEARFPLSAEVRLLLIAGFCGAFTTFSTLIFEFYSLIQSGLILRAFLYALLSFILGFGLFCAGIWVAQKIA